MPQRGPVHILGVPMDLGQERRGVDMGPAAVRYAGLYERLRDLQLVVDDTGNVAVPAREEYNDDPADQGERNARYLGPIARVLTDVYSRSRQIAKSGAFGIFLGGDHSISLGTVGGQAALGRVGVVWVDAHADFNTPATSPSGNIHGMPLACLLGEGPDALVNLGHAGRKVEPGCVTLVGVRSIDRDERDRLRESGVHLYTMSDIDDMGMRGVALEVVAHLHDCDRVHVSLDLDSLDPEEAPGVGTPVPGGLTYREAHRLMEILAGLGNLSSLDLVEINPILDDRNTTATLAVELAASLLGQRII
jgi:arginase